MERINQKQLNLISIRNANYEDDSIYIESLGLHYIDRSNRFSDLNQRINTFLTWPIQMKQSGYLMALSGQVFSGQSDRTYCFKCLYTFALWNSNNDPWEAHAMWSPHCEYVIKMKGEIFMQEMAKQRKISIDAPPIFDGFSFSYRNPIVSCPTSRLIALPSKETSELAEGEEKFLCKICCSTQYEIALNCGHISTCLKCSIQLLNCPICRCKITTKLKVYFQ